MISRALAIAKGRATLNIHQLYNTVDINRRKLLRHEEIELSIRQKVVSGAYASGSMLPGRRDLAKEHGVSTITVGRAIDGLVREGLLRSDDRRGTFVSSSSVAMAVTPSRPLTIAVVATLFPPQKDYGYGHNPWTRQVVASVEGGFAGSEHHTIFVNTVEGEETTPLETAVERALEAKPDGVIVVAFSNGVDEIEASQRILLQSGLPCALISSTEVNRPIPHVFPDGFDAGYQAGRHLVQQGCREVAYISPYRSWWAEQRFLGIVSAFEHAGLGAEAVKAYPTEAATEWRMNSDTHTAGFEAALPALRERVDKRGFVGSNDEIASGVIDAGNSLGLAEGRDYLLVGFDDISEARDLHLTSLRIPWNTIGAEAARLLKQSMAQKNECLQVRVRWQLISRSSSRWQVTAKVSDSLAPVA